MSKFELLQIIVNPKLLRRLSDSFGNFSANQNDELRSLSRDGMILGVGTTKISIKIGYISYDISSECKVTKPLNLNSIFDTSSDSRRRFPHLRDRFIRSRNNLLSSNRDLDERRQCFKYHC